MRPRRAVGGDRQEGRAVGPRRRVRAGRSVGGARPEGCGAGWCAGGDRNRATDPPARRRCRLRPRGRRRYGRAAGQHVRRRSRRHDPRNAAPAPSWRPRARHRQCPAQRSGSVCWRALRPARHSMRRPRCEPTASKAFATSPNAMGWCSSKGSSPGRRRRRLVLRAGAGRSDRTSAEGVEDKVRGHDCPARSTLRFHALAADRKFFLKSAEKPTEPFAGWSSAPGKPFASSTGETSVQVDPRNDVYSAREIALAAGVPEAHVLAFVGRRMFVPYAEAVRIGRAVRRDRSVETQGIGALFSIFSAAGARAGDGARSTDGVEHGASGPDCRCRARHDVRHDANRDHPGRRRTRRTGAPGVFRVSGPGRRWRRRRSSSEGAATQSASRRPPGSQQSDPHSRAAPAN